MKPVTLHIGVPKTGSTFLQRWIEENRELLATRGLHTIPLMSCHRIAAECILDPHRREKADSVRLLEISLEDARKKLAKGLTRASVFRCIVSSEYFADADPAATAAFFIENDLDIDTVVCFVRRQDRAIASGISQSVKATGKSKIPDRFEYMEYFNWHRLYTRWREAFPAATLIFRNYDKHRRDNTLLQAFKQGIGFVGDGEEDRLPSIEQSNPSLNATLLEIGRLANERGHEHVGRFLLKAQFNGFEGPRYGLSQEKVTGVEKLYVDGNAALARELGSDELEELAVPGWESDVADVNDQVSIETLIDLLAHAVSRLPISEIQPAHAPHVAADLSTHQPSVTVKKGAEPPVVASDAPASEPHARKIARIAMTYLLNPVFDTKYYLSTYPDVAKAGANPWQHYLSHGRKEGRMRKPGALVFSGNTRLFKPSKETVLVVLHEGSRTGAPIIGYNLVLGLLDRYNVVVLCLAPGPVAEACSLAGAYVAAARGRAESWVSGDAFIRRLAKSFSFKFAIVNAIGSRFVLRKLVDLDVPVITLIHEFAGNVRPLSDFIKTVEWSAATVFPSSLTRENALQLLPALRGRHFPLIPQGRCALPPGIDACDMETHDEVREALGLDRSPADTMVVIGVGYVSYRKGVDLFIQCASRFARRFKDIPVRFVWVGDAYRPETDGQYSAFLADQIRQEKLDGLVHFTGEILNMDAVYALADLLLLPSRLDPLPNVCIEAMAAGLPILCFDGTTGFVDILNRRGLGSSCVARYLDVEDMTEKAGKLAASPKLRAEVAEMSRNIVTEEFSMPDYVERIEKVALQAVTSRHDARPT